ncbi:hypothetical protein [Tenacibaculum pacificus]|uniref:hypothetical protein n=1 Tax=Tenacibaculum pacificus TaxID=3018314 RepID=UPI002FDE307C
MENLLIEAENFVVTLLNEKLDTSFIYHNVLHTQRVVAKTKELIKEAELTTELSNILLLTAWFQ